MFLNYQALYIFGDKSKRFCCSSVVKTSHIISSIICLRRKKCIELFIFINFIFRLTFYKVYPIKFNPLKDFAVFKLRKINEKIFFLLKKKNNLKICFINAFVGRDLPVLDFYNRVLSYLSLK